MTAAAVKAPPCGCLIRPNGRNVCAWHLVLTDRSGNLLWPTNAAPPAAEPAPKDLAGPKSKNAFKRATPKTKV